MSGQVDNLFAQLVAMEAARRRPPVMNWHPERVGRIDIRIAADGTWYHEGSPIRRAALVNLFATILRLDPDGYCLVTPAEKLLISVDDLPFQAIDMEVTGSGATQSLLFLTNVGDSVIADADHPLRVVESVAGPQPAVMIRNGLEARLSRPVWYRLVERAVEEADGLAVYSAGECFRLGAA